VSDSNFDGDGRSELLVRSPTHIGILGPTQTDVSVLDIQAFGYPIDRQWTLNASDRIHGVGDFDNNGVAQFKF